jgi:hypothetical protein
MLEANRELILPSNPHYFPTLFELELCAPRIKIEVYMIQDLSTETLVWQKISEGAIKDMSGMEAICPKCGGHFYGWALCSPHNQWCPKCGCGLKITLGGEHLGTGYSPFTAAEYKLDLNLKPEITRIEEGKKSLPFKTERN